MHWLIYFSFGNFVVISSFNTKNMNTYLATTKINPLKIIRISESAKKIYAENVEVCRSENKSTRKLISARTVYTLTFTI